MDTEANIEREEAHCRTCGQSFLSSVCRSPFDAARILARQLHCEPCVEAEKHRIEQAEAARKAHKAEEDMRAAWDRICPAEYRTRLEGGNTDLDRLTREQHALAEVLQHPMGPMGLILRGGTGACKTRSMYRLLRSYFLTIPRPRIIAMSAGQFDRECRDAGGTFKLTEWFNRLARADVLFVDDLGKTRWTAGTAGHFWGIVDERCANARPVFLTTNFPGDKLVQVLGLDGDTAEPLLRRLREHCKIIVMKPNRNKP